MMGCYYNKKIKIHKFMMDNTLKIGFSNGNIGGIDF